MGYGRKDHRTMEEYYDKMGFLPKNKKGVQGEQDDLEARYKINVQALRRNTALPFDRTDDIKYAKKKGNSKLAKALKDQK